METFLTKTAGELALQGSGWAVAVLLGAWSFYLFKTIREDSKELRGIIKESAAIAESSKAGLAAAAKAIDQMGVLIGTLTQAVQGLSREVAGDETETRHGLKGIAHGQEGIAGRVDRLTERIEKLSERVADRTRP